MTVTAFLGSVQNCSRTGEKASLLLSSCKKKRKRERYDELALLAIKLNSTVIKKFTVLQLVKLVINTGCTGLTWLP